MTYSEIVDHSDAVVTITERIDGTIRIEAIGRREYIAALGGDMEYTPAPLAFVYDWGARDAKPGDAGCLAESYSVAGGDDKCAVWMGANPAGICGNMSNERALTGWIGTTGDRAIIAHGWRLIISIEPRKHGIGWVAILSRDLGGPAAVKDAAAAAMGRKGGKSKSPAKVTAARKNVAKARKAIDPEKRARAVAASNRRRAKK